MDVLGAGSRITRAREQGLVGVLHVGVVVRAKVVVARCALRLVREGVHGATAWVHGTGEHLANGVAARRARRAHPQGGVHLGGVNKAKLHGIGAVEHHDHAIEVALDHGEKVLLVGRKLKVAAAGLGALIGGHVRGKVKTFAALAGEHHDRRVRVRLCVVDDVLGVAGLRQLVEVPVRAHNAHVLGSSCVLLVELLKVGVRGEARVLKSLVEGHVLAGVASSGARPAIAEIVSSRRAKHVHLGHARKRQGVVLVLEQRDAFRLHLLGDVARGLTCLPHLGGCHVRLGSERGHEVKVRRHHDAHHKRHRNHEHRQDAHDHKQRLLWTLYRLGRLGLLVLLVCHLSPFPWDLAFPPHNRGGGSVRWPHGGQDARRLGAAVIIG